MKKRVLFSLSVILVCYLIFLFFSPLYVGTDNITCAIVVDGLFGSNNFCQFQHPLFCIFVKLLTPLFPAADMFTVVIHLLVAIGLFLTAFVGFGLLPPFKRWRLEEYIYVVILLTFLIFLSAGINIWNNNYTVTAGALVLIGLTVLTASAAISGSVEYRNKRIDIVALFLIAMGFMLRKESGLLFLPFIGLNAIRQVIESRDAHVLRHYLPGMMIIALLLISQMVFTSVEPYATAARYNAARTACVDFPMKNWNETMDIEKVDYDAARSWIYADTEVLDAENLERIAAAGGTDAYSRDWKGFIAAVDEMKNTLFHTDLYLSVLIVITILLVLRNLVCSGMWGKVETLLSLLGAFLILVYFIMRGRAPTRVWEPVLFAVNWTLISVWGSSRTSRHREKRTILNTVSLLLIGITLWFGAGQVIAHSQMNPTIRTALTARVNADDGKFEGTGEGLFLWPNWWSSVQRYYSAQGKLPSKEILRHNIPLGFWVSGQVYFNEMLVDLGAANPARALLERSDTYLVEGQEETVLAQMRKHYGEDLQLVDAGEIGDRKYYRIERGEG